MLINILGFIIFLLIITLITSPLYFVIKYPEVATSVAVISKTLIPWLTGLLVLLIFNDGVKTLFSVIARKIEGLKGFSAAGTKTEFEDRQKEVISLTTEEYEQLSKEISNLQDSKKIETGHAWNYYVKYLASSIFGTQVKLLQELNAKGALTFDEIKPFYEEFLKIQKNKTTYEFHSYLNYLNSNFLVQYDKEKKTYLITKHGKFFMSKLEEYGVKWDIFPG